MRDEIVVIGFPKCGTTALMKRFDNDQQVDVLRSKTGGYEIGWPMIRETERAPAPNKIAAHKFTAYIYKPKTLE